MRKITPEQASAAYDVLIQHAGARDTPDERYAFVYHVAISDHPTMEYRFGGNLGWGGKFRNNGNRGNTPHVDCYREHLTKKTEAVIIACNADLAALFG